MWMYAVTISMGALVVLSLTVCILLLRDHYLDMEEKRLKGATFSQLILQIFFSIKNQNFISNCFFSFFLTEEEEWETIGIIPNIILNPGFYEAEDPNDPSPPYSRTIIFGEDVLSTSESGSEEEEPISFKRKFSLFFTGDTIKRL